MKAKDFWRKIFARRQDLPQADEAIRIHPIRTMASHSEAALLRDGSLYTILNLLCEISLSAKWRFEGEDREANAELLQAITDAEGFIDLLRALIWTTATRFAVAEIIWKTEPFWAPARYRVLPRDAVQLDIDGRGEVQAIRVYTSAGEQVLPLNRAIIYRNRPTFEHPEGSSILDHLKEDISYKRRADDALAKNSERFGAPYTILRYPLGMSESQKQELLRQGSMLQSASVAVLPEGVGVELLEPKGGSAQFALETVSYFERRLARAILGSILAMYEAEYGTRAQSQTHWQVVKYVVAAYQANIETIINSQLIAPVLAYNGAPPAVAFKLNEPNLMEKGDMARWVADLAEAGVLDLEADRDLIRQMFGLE